MPRAFCLEMTDNAVNVHEGAEIDMLLHEMSDSYVIKYDIVQVWRHGDPTSRRRLFIVGMHKGLGKYASDFEFPTPEFDESNAPSAIHIAVPDNFVPDELWIHQSLDEYMIQNPSATPGTTHPIAQVGQKGDIGHSSKPATIYSWHGLFNTQLTTNGGGRRPSLSWTLKKPLNLTRLTTPEETVACASLPDDYLPFARDHSGGQCACHGEESKDDFLRRCVNSGIPLRTGTAIDLRVMAILKAAGVKPDVRVPLPNPEPNLGFVEDGNPQNIPLGVPYTVSDSTTPPWVPQNPDVLMCSLIDDEVQPFDPALHHINNTTNMDNINKYGDKWECGCGHSACESDGYSARESQALHANATTRCPRVSKPYPRKWLGLDNIIRCIHVDSMANATFLNESMKHSMTNPRKCNARIQVANKQFMSASAEGNVPCYVLNMSNDTSRHADVQSFNMHGISVPELNRELLSVDDMYKYGGYSPLLKHPNLNDGIPELYRPPTESAPESRIPLCYDWYGNGGFCMYYIPKKDVSPEHLYLLESHMKDMSDVNESCMKAFDASLMSEYDCDRISKELYAHEGVVEVVGSPHEPPPSYTIDVKSFSSDPVKGNTVKTTVLHTQHPDDRMTKGTQFGLKRGRNALSHKEFHELYGHLGYCEGCKLCKEVKGNMRRIKTKFNPHREQRAGYAWAMDTIEFKVRSEEGHKYLIVLRCLATGAFHYIPLFLKSDAKEAFRDWVTETRNDPLFKDFDYPLICYVRTDNAGEWGPRYQEWQDMCKDMPGGKVKMIYVDAQRHAEENGYAEVAVGITEIVIKSLLYERNLPPSWWQRCAADALLLLNRFPVVSSDVAIPLDGDIARPLEMLTRGCYSRRQIDRELSYYVGVGTPCIVHDKRVKGSALRPKTRWGIACGMYREQVWFLCPFTGDKFRSKSYTAYRLKSGLSPWQFLRLPQPKSSRKSMAIPNDRHEGKNIIHLREPLAHEEYKFIDCSPRIESDFDLLNKIRDRDSTEPESRGSIHVKSHEGRLISVDKDDGEMYYVDTEDQYQDDTPQEDEEGKGPTSIVRVDVDKLKSDDEVEERVNPSPQIPSPMEGEIPVLARDANRAKRSDTRSSKRRKEDKGSATAESQGVKPNLNHKPKGSGGPLKHKPIPKPNKIGTHIPQSTKLDKNRDDIGFMCECEIETDTSTSDEIEELSLKSKQIVTTSYDTMKHIVNKRHRLGFGFKEIYHQWLVEEKGINPKHIPCEPVQATVKAGLRLPYPSGKRWRELCASIKGQKHGLETQIVGDDYIEYMTETLCDDGRMIAKVCYDALLYDTGMEELSLEEPSALHAYAARLTGKELNALLRARRRKASRKGKATNSGEEIPPSNLTEAFAHPTRGEMWRKAALTEFEGLTNMGVFDHDYSWDELGKVGIDTKIKPPLPLSVVCDHKYDKGGNLDRLKVRMAIAGHPGNMQRGVHYDQTFAATPGQHSSRVLQAIMVRNKYKRLAWDIKQAYCWAEVDSNELFAVKYILKALKGMK